MEAGDGVGFSPLSLSLVSASLTAALVGVKGVRPHLASLHDG